MCRWLAYSGPEIYLEDLIIKPSRSLLVQSRFARENYVENLPGLPDGAFPTNGDGFGVAWYGTRERPGLYRDLRPAWSDKNLVNLAEQIKSGLFLAHLRAAYHGIVQRTNSHPFRHDCWTFQHNGEISGFEKIKRTLQFAVDEDLFSCIQGTTDSETAFFLALSFGLAEDPHQAMARMVGFVEAEMKKAGITDPFRLTCAFSDGKTLYAIRHATDDKPKTLYYNRTRDGLDEVINDAREAPNGGVTLLSEPIDDCPDNWVEVPSGSFVTVAGGQVKVEPFRPIPPGGPDPVKQG
ncbi:MAG: class II glutamine amidotransferase [Wenzhouxiangella sp.]|nr:MAG: class II glutamine amidotransferase [Wenzhouxiangella sp.]